MKAEFIAEEQFKNLLSELAEVKALIAEKQKESIKDAIISQKEFTKMFKISVRTAQTWRDEGVVSFTQIGGKIYYRMSDVQILLDNNYKKAFRPKSKISV